MFFDFLENLILVVYSFCTWTLQNFIDWCYRKSILEKNQKIVSLMSRFRIFSLRNCKSTISKYTSKVKYQKRTICFTRNRDHQGCLILFYLNKNRILAFYLNNKIVKSILKKKSLMTPITVETDCIDIQGFKLLNLVVY